MQDLNLLPRTASTAENSAAVTEAEVFASPQPAVPSEPVPDEVQEMNIDGLDMPDAPDDDLAEYEVRDIAVGPDVPYALPRRGKQGSVEYEDKGTYS